MTASANGPERARSCGSRCPRTSGTCAARCPRRTAGSVRTTGPPVRAARQGISAARSKQRRPLDEFAAVDRSSRWIGCRTDDQLRRMQLVATLVFVREDSEEPLERALAEFGDPDPNGRQPDDAWRAGCRRSRRRRRPPGLDCPPPEAPAARRSPYCRWPRTPRRSPGPSEAARRPRRAPDSSAKSPRTISHSTRCLSQVRRNASARSCASMIARWAGDMDEPRAATRDQMFDNRLGARGIVEMDRRSAHSRRRAY